MKPRHRTGGFLGQAVRPAADRHGRGLPVGAGVRGHGVRSGRRVSAGRLRALPAPAVPGPAGDIRRGDAAGQDFRRLQERAWDLVTGPEARRAFDLKREPGRVATATAVTPWASTWCRPAA